MSALLLILLALVFFFIIKFTAAVTAIVAIVAGTTTITILACVWLGTSYYLKASGYKTDKAQDIYHQVNSDLKSLIEGVRETRLELEAVEPYLRDVEFLRYARQNPKSEN